MFGSGLAGIAYETIANHGDRPTLLILFGGMVGLPALLHGDERLTSTKKAIERVTQMGSSEGPSEDEEEEAGT